ncbi:MAG: hypothetical protein ACON48_07715 [Chitinophagales bacterium]
MNSSKNAKITIFVTVVLATLVSIASAQPPPPPPPPPAAGVPLDGGILALLAGIITFVGSRVFRAKKNS